MTRYISAYFTLNPDIRSTIKIIIEQFKGRYWTLDDLSDADIHLPKNCVKKLLEIDIIRRKRYDKREIATGVLRKNVRSKPLYRVSSGCKDWLWGKDDTQ